MSHTIVSEFQERRRPVPWWKQVISRWDVIVFLLGTIIYIVKKDQRIDDAIALGKDTADRVDRMEPTLAALKQGQDDMIAFFHVRRH